MFAGWKYRHDPLVDPVFRRWFDGSVVVEPDGAPKVVYHAGSFDEELDGAFDVDAGVHFGTKQAAEARIVGKYIDDSILNTYVDEDAAGRFRLDEDEWPQAPADGFASRDAALAWVADELNENFDPAHIDDEAARITVAYLRILRPLRVPDQRADWTAAIARAKAEGHDGLVYRNEIEHRGSESYVVFSSAQVKSVNNRGTFDPADPHVLHGWRGLA